jgi:hypothetical protein
LPDHLEATRARARSRDDALCEAIEAFQRDHALEVTGVVDERTLRALMEAHGV